MIIDMNYHFFTDNQTVSETKHLKIAVFFWSLGFVFVGNNPRLKKEHKISTSQESSIWYII